MGRPPPDEDSGVLLESLGSSGSSASSGSSGFEDASQQEEQDSEEVEDNGSVLSDSEEECQIKKMYDEWPDSEEEEEEETEELEPKYTVFLPGAEEEEETEEQRNERHHKMLRYQEIVSAVEPALISGKIDIKMIRDLGIGTTIRRTVREGDMVILTNNEYEFTIPPADEEVDNRYGMIDTHGVRYNSGYTTNGRSKQQIQYFYGMKILALQKKEPNSAEELETYLDARFDKDTGRGCLKATHFLQLISMYTDPEAPDHIFKRKAYSRMLGLTMWNEHDDEYCNNFSGMFSPEFKERCRRSFLETALSSSEFILSYDIEYDIQIASNWSTPENCNWGLLTRSWKDLVVKHLKLARIAREKLNRRALDRECKRTADFLKKEKEEEAKQKQARARVKAAKDKQDADDKEKLRKDLSASMESRMKRAKEKKEKEENDALLAELYQQEREDKERQEQTEKSRAGAKRKADAIQPTMDTGKKKEPRKSNYDPNKPKPNKTCAQHPKDANMCSLVPVENLCKFCMKAKRKAAKK